MSAFLQQSTLSNKLVPSHKNMPFHFRDLRYNAVPRIFDNFDPVVPMGLKLS